MLIFTPFATMPLRNSMKVDRNEGLYERIGEAEIVDTNDYYG